MDTREKVLSYLFSIFETLGVDAASPASPDGTRKIATIFLVALLLVGKPTPRDGLKVNSKAFRPEDAKQIQNKETRKKVGAEGDSQALPDLNPRQPVTPMVAHRQLFWLIAP